MKTASKYLRFISLVLFMSMFFSAQLLAEGVNKTVREVPDQTITENIKAAIANDKMVKDLGVKVETQKGVVTLTGIVNTDIESSRIIEIAQSTAGVKDVNTTALTAKKSEQPYSDTVITAKVKGLFIREKLFGGADVAPLAVRVETVNGTVYLTGEVDSQVQADNAVKLAQSVSNVKGVESKITVK